MNCLRSLTLLVLASLVGAPLHALPPQSDHGSITAVPVPTGGVKIDGTLEGWDTSGEILIYNARNLRDRYAVRLSALHDAEALYLGLRWRDPTPMINNVDPVRAPGEGWMSDSFQGRFITNISQVHFTAWYSSKHDKAVATFYYDGALNEAGKRVFHGEGRVMDDASGFAMGFKRDSDNRGYVQTIRIPWTLLYREGAKPTVGGEFTFSGEYFWGGPTGTRWPAVMWADPINLAQKQRVVLYQSPQNWGKLRLSPTGNLPREELEEQSNLLQGPISVRVELPADATRFTLAIDDASGVRVRNLASHANVSDYLVSSTATKKVVEVPWDGRAEGPWDKERQIFVGDFVAPGSYTATALAHRGVGVLHEGSFYNPGRPTWPTADGLGGFLSDHSPHTSVGVMPKSAATRGRVFLGSHGGETGNGFIGLDATDQKFWEWVRLGAGAWYIAGSEAHVYFAHGGIGSPGANVLGRSNPDTGEQQNFDDGRPEVPLPDVAGGLAYHAGTLAVSIPSQNKVLILDAKTGSTLREIAVQGPGVVAFAPSGALVGVTGKALFIADAGAGSVQRKELPGVTPTAVTFDSVGRAYVGDLNDLTVKVYDAQWNPVLTVGEPGGHTPGPWNSQRMNRPGALAIEDRPDGASRLWVVEHSIQPKRTSVWDPKTGKLLRDFIGTTGYMGSGGLLHDNFAQQGVYVGIRFHVDYENLTYTPMEIMGGAPPQREGKVSLFHVGANPGGALTFGNGFMFMSSASGAEREYFVEGHVSPNQVFMKRGDRWLCVAAIGHGAGVRFPEAFPKSPGPNAVFSWSDLNKDGYQDADEVQWFDPGQPNVLRGGWGYRCDANLAWYHSGLAFSPVRWTDDGAPIYDVTKAERLPGAAGQLVGDIHKTRFGYFGGLQSGEGLDAQGVIHGLHWFAGFDAQGNLRWRYPNYWIAVHGAFSAPMAIPGVVMGSLKISGTIHAAEPGGHDILSIRGNTGQEFLLRDDGLYVGELFTDQRLAPSRLPSDPNIRGVPVNDTTLGGEPFNGWIGRQNDGKVRMTYGETDVRVAQVVGLESVADASPVRVELTAEMVQKARAFTPKLGADAQTTTYALQRGGAFDVNNLAFDNNALSLRLGKEEQGKAMLRFDEANLHVAWQVFDPTPLVNKGTLPAEAFKSGDGVNVFVAPAGAQGGGVRLLLASLANGPTAVAYKPAGPGDAAYTFVSPVRASTFQYVAVQPSVTWQSRPGSGEYFVTASIPWAVLDVTPAAGGQLRGDVGILFGDETGGRTGQRVQWVDKQTNVVNDTPTEAEFSPLRWGTFTLP